MQPFALAVAALKAVALMAVVLEAVELEAVELASSALEAWTQGQGRLQEDEILGEETRQRLKLTDLAHGSVLLQADRRANQIEQIILLPRVGRAPSQSSRYIVSVYSCWAARPGSAMRAARAIIARGRLAIGGLILRTGSRRLAILRTGSV